MSTFLKVTIKEKIDGTPGLVEDHLFELALNLDEVCMIYRTPDPEMTVVTMKGGVSMFVLYDYDKFIEFIEKQNNSVLDLRNMPNAETKQKPKKKK